jgi:hypothetical protein
MYWNFIAIDDVIKNQFLVNTILLATFAIQARPDANLQETSCVSKEGAQKYFKDKNFIQKINELKLYKIKAYSEILHWSQERD